MSSKLIPVCVLVAAGACASSASTPATTPGVATAEQTAPSRDRDVITQQELAQPEVRAQSVLDVVRSLRPQYLNERGKNSHSDEEAGKVHISIDNGRILPLDELQNIHANTVLEIRYLNIAAAMQKFGGAAREGPVILVRMLK